MVAGVRFPDPRLTNIERRCHYERLGLSRMWLHQYGKQEVSQLWFHLEETGEVAMNHVTIQDQFAGNLIEVSVLLETPEDGWQKIGALVQREQLRRYVTGFDPVVIWHDNILVEFCIAEGCNNLIRRDDLLCQDCLKERQPVKRELMEAA